MDNKIEEILQSFDGMERANADPYLYSKIINRLAASERPQSKLAWNLVFVLLVIAAVNLFTLFSVISGRTEVKNKSAIVSREYEILPSSTY